MTRTIRLFLSSPSDVMTEQQTVISLADEINDVVAFLTPQLDVKLEVFRYQERALTLARRNANDPPRINMLEQARRELLTKRKQSPT